MTPQLFVVEGGADDDGDDELFEELPADPASESQARSTLHGKEFDAEALEFVGSLGARLVEQPTVYEGHTLDFLIESPNGCRFMVGAHGTPDRRQFRQAGMRRTDTIMKFGFRAWRLAERSCPYPVLLITSHLPTEGSRSAFYLAELHDVLLDAVAIVGDLPGAQRLQHYFTTDFTTDERIEPLPAPWRALQLGFEFDAADTGGTDA